MNAATRRSEPRTDVMEGYYNATKPKRTPSHRAPGPARTPETVPTWVRSLLAANGKANTNV